MLLFILQDFYNEKKNIYFKNVIGFRIVRYYIIKDVVDVVD